MARKSLEEIYGVQTSNTQVATSGRRSLEEIYGVSNNQTPAINQPEIKQPGFLASIGNAITDPFVALGGGVQNAIRAGGRALGFNTQAQTELPSVFGGTVDPVGYREGQELGALDTTQQLAGNLAMAGSNFVGGGTVATVGRGVLAKTLPRVLPLAKEGAVAFGAQMGGQAMEEGQSAGDVAIETAKGVGLGTVLTPLVGVPLGLIPLATKSGRQAVTKQLESKYTQQASEDWARVGNDYIKSGGVLSRETKFGKDSTKFLGELGISPSDLVSGGKFQTEDIAGQLSTTAIKDFDNTLTDMLSAAQFTKVKPSIAQMKNIAISKVDDIRNVTAAQKEDIIKNIEVEFAALQRQYGDSISLPAVNQQKGTYWANTRFDSTKPFQGDVNYVIGSTMKDIIEKSVPDAPVRELNNLLGNYYSAAKFLRSINNRVPKLTTGQKLTGTLSRAAGTLTGGAIGGPGGAISGYLFGKSLSDVLRKASNPLKKRILNNLEKTNPAVYEEALKYIGQQQVEIWKNVTIKPGMSASAQNEINEAIKRATK